MDQDTPRRDYPSSDDDNQDPQADYPDQPYAMDDLDADVYSDLTDAGLLAEPESAVQPDDEDDTGTFDATRRYDAPDLNDLDQVTPANGVTPVSGASPVQYKPILPAWAEQDDDTPIGGVTPVSGTPIPGLDVDFTPPVPPRERPHRGRARERIAQRKQKRGESTVAASARPSPVKNVPPPTARTVKDPTSVITRGITSVRSAAKTGAGARAGTGTRAAGDTAPVVRLPINRTGLYIIGSVIFIIAVVVVLGEIRNRPAEVLPNALWIGTEWTYEDPDDQSVFELTRRLRDHQIGTVYAWVSWLQPDASWRGEANFENVKTFVTRFNENYPEAELLGWISFPVEVEPVGYRMDDADIQQQVADFAVRVVNEFGFDGVFLNIEMVWNNDENFLALLRRVRLALGDDVTISVAVPPDWSPIGAGIPVPPLIVPGTVWDTDYKQSVALLVDEMAIMAYNSGLGAGSDYAQWVAYQVSAFADAVYDLGIATELVIGIPTYDAEPPGHDPRVENVITAVEGLKLGLEQAGDAAFLVRGAAIYAGWTTDDQEWQDFMLNWVSR